MSEYKIIRSNMAGVFLAKVERKEHPQNIVMLDARRLWRWSGATTVSELALKGVSNAPSCKFDAPVSRIEIFDIVEILDATEEAVANLKAVPVWSQHE